MSDDKRDVSNKSLKPQTKKVTMRESAAKSREKASSTKRIRKAANAAKKPAGKLGSLLTMHFHVLPTSDDGFFTKPRQSAPRYVIESAKELRNVTWPKRKETWRLVLAVFIFASVLGVSIALLDFGLEKLLREVIL